MKTASLFLLALLALALPARAQTNILFAFIGDNSTNAQAGITARLVYTGLQPRQWNPDLIISRASQVVSDAAGYIWFTNVTAGPYQLYVASDWARNLTVYTNTLGLVPLASLITNDQTPPANPATNYYNIPQVNALLAAITGPTNLATVDTNNLTVAGDVAGLITNTVFSAQGTAKIHAAISADVAGSNYVTQPQLTGGTNASNAQAQIYANAIGLNDTNQSSLIGANATNNTAAGTNAVLAYVNLHTNDPVSMARLPVNVGLAPDSCKVPAPILVIEP